LETIAETMPYLIRHIIKEITSQKRNVNFSQFRIPVAILMSRRCGT
jgi:hypothetical protein